ncbi:MAG: RNase adapter RapZ [Armatimonadota bacterium]|nr:RNase adapter RapZ [Armatimonadota bacterium]
MHMVIVTGLSGAGKTQAIRALEDLGYFCVDNMPPTLIPRFAELLALSGDGVRQVGLVVDIRGGQFFQDLFEALRYLDLNGYQYEILFLEASDEALIRRFKETRRRHPLSPQGHIMEGIGEERRRLEELRGRADKIIDTSDLSTRQLREQVAELFGAGGREKLVITVLSFGYKYGLPLDADLVVDVRFLPNPHYVESLQGLTGRDVPVADYVLASPVTREFLQRFLDLLGFLIPYYVQEGKSQLVIAIGCTGGQHRSVTLAERVFEALRQYKDCRVTVKHRDISRRAEVE